jgi:hypothetical protein
MNWRRGLLRLWVILSVVWTAGLAALEQLSNRHPLTKPPIVVHWGNEEHEFPGETNKEIIRRALERRATAMDAEAESVVERMTAARKALCATIPATTNFFDDLPSDCETVARGGAKHVIPSDWENALTSQPITLAEALERMWPVFFGPPLLLLSLGIMGFWVARGFRVT